ncbi:MAG: aminotransferase class IV [Phycisphaerales bacterium]
MMMFFLNGEFVSGEAAPRVSALDAGLQHGLGLFETMLGGVGRAGQAWVLQLDEHLERLAESARTLGLSTSVRTGALGEAVLETVRRSGEARARVRLTITGGDLNMLAQARAAGDAKDTRRAGDPTVLVAVQPATVYPRGMIEQGVSVTVADTRANPLDAMAGHKTLSYWWRLRELQMAGSRQAAEALVFSVTNHLVGGCVSSAVLIRRGEAVVPIARGEEEAVARGREPGEEHGTPGEGGSGGSSGAVLRSPVLPGVTRSWAIRTLEGLGVLCRRRMLTISDVLEADEIMLTNSSWGVLPVVRVEAAAIGAGEPGERTRGLCAAWAREIEEMAARG